MSKFIDGRVCQRKRSNSVYVVADGVAHLLTREGAAHYLRVGRSLGYKWRYCEHNNLPCWSAQP